MTYSHPDILKNTPYNDDFEDTKKFLRILFKPGYSVQARELTQLQTLLQNQISKFGDHIFRDGSLVFGGLTSLNKVSYVRVNPNYIENNLKLLEDKIVTNNVGTVRAKCLYVLPATTEDNFAIIFLQYTSGKEFSINEQVYVEDVGTRLTNFWGGVSGIDTVVTQSGTALTASVDEGIFYVDGFFVKSDKQVTPLYKTQTDGTRTFESPSNRVGFTVQRVIINANYDSTLKDPANGAYNYNAPGADRYKIDLVLSSEVYSGDFVSSSFNDLSSKDFIELARVVNGKLTFIKKLPTYSELLEIFARRTYDESGNYTVKPFNINIKENLRRDRLSLIVELNSGSASAGADSVLSFSIIDPPTSTTSYTITDSDSTRLPPSIGDKLISSSSGIEYTIVSIKTINITSGTVELLLVPKDTDITTANNPYGSKLLKFNERLSLKRIGGIDVIVDNHYKVLSNIATIITDVSGQLPLLSGGSSDKFSIDIFNGKAYIFGYEYETTNPLTITQKKPRQYTSVINEIIDTSLGNYLMINSTSISGIFYFDATNKSYDMTFDFNDFSDVLLKKQFATLIIPNNSDEYSKFHVKYYSPSERNSLNPYQTLYSFYDWESIISSAPSDSERIADKQFYPDVILLQNADAPASDVLRSELGTGVDDGFILRRDVGNNDTNIYYNILLPNTANNTPLKYAERTTSDGDSVRRPQYDDSVPFILDSSYETETNISRLVFRELWHGDFKTAYDSSLESYNPITDKLTRTYVDDSTNYVYQLDYIGNTMVPVDSGGNVSLTNLSSKIRVKKAYTRAWVPGSSGGTGGITPSSLFIKVPSQNVVFGDGIGLSRGFCLPDLNPSVQESGVVFNPTSGKEISYGSSIAASSQEYNVVEIKLLTAPTIGASCAQTLGSITTRGFGQYTESSTVTQTYVVYQGGGTNGTTVTVQGTVVKVLNYSSGSDYRIFVRMIGTGNFIPQEYDGKTISGVSYEGVSALLMSDNILTAPICACHSIKSLDLLDDKTGTCGIFTTIYFDEAGSEYGDFLPGETVYQYDIDYIPLDNSTVPTNWDGTKVLAQATVVDWDSSQSKLTIIVTKNEFKQKSGWIFGNTSKVKYGGRGWSTNYHKSVPVRYTGTTSDVNEIERVKGILVWINPISSAFYSDEFNTSDTTIQKIAHQVKSFTNENTLYGTVWSEELIALTRPPMQQTYKDLTTGETITAQGLLTYFREGSPVAGPSIMTLEADPTNRSAFLFKIKTANPIQTPTSYSPHPLVFNLLYAEKVKPQVSIYSSLETEAEDTSTIISTTTVAKAKAKQIKYVPKSGTVSKEQYHLYLTDIIPYSVEGSLFKVDNIYSVVRAVGSSGSEITLFKIGDVSQSETQALQYNLQQPKNNSLLYNYPVGDKIKRVTDLTYELQIDLLAEYNSTTRTLLFTTDVLGQTEFKGSYDLGSSRFIDQSILNEYILVGSDSRITDLTNTNEIESIKVLEGTTKTLQIIFKSTSSVVSSGIKYFRLFCPLVIKGSIGSNIRKKTKKRGIEINRFDPVTGVMTLKKSDVISIDSCINLGTKIELPKQAYVLNNNQTLNVYKLSSINGTEKWRDLNIRKTTSGTVTTQANGIWCLVSYTYYDHGTEYGPIIPESYVDGYDTIPSFYDPLTNNKINLDSVIDFRPFEKLDDQGRVVTTGVYGVPISGSRMNVSYEYYLPQNYKLVLSRDKNFYMLEGEASTNPQYPRDLPNAMTLFNIELTPYLTNASDSKIVSLNHQRYTMDDIRGLEERIGNIEYITKLSYLEQNAKNISIRDNVVTYTDKNGLLIPISNERPKTSILVDTFINHDIADTNNPDYNACIDSTENVLRPPFKLNQLDLVLNTKQSSGSYVLTNSGNYNTTNNGQSIPPNILTLSNTPYPLIKQLLATKTIEVNPFSSTVWLGTLTSDISRDPSFDISTKPYILSNYNGENDSFENMSYSPNNLNLGAFGTKWNFWQKNWQGYNDQQKSVKSLLGRVEEQIKALTPKTPKKKNGEKSINVDVVPYMPANTITVYGKGLKPLTVIYPYFDGIRIDAYVTPLSSAMRTTNGFTTDSYGNFDFTFSIPSGIFQSGDKNLVLMDDQNNDRTLCTTYAELKYSNSAVEEVNDYYNTFGTKVIDATTNNFNDYSTILAQTFFVDPAIYPKGLYLKRVDLYFNTLDKSGLPIFLEVRPVVDGTPLVGPGSYAYPYSKVIKKPNTMTTVSNGVITSNNGTPFVFDAPVHLLPGEHALVLKTNSNEYSLYSAEVGEELLYGGTRATPQPYVGRMMKTNNSQSWTIFENEDLAFNIYRCAFNNSAQIVFTDPVETMNEVKYSLLNVNMSYSDLNSNSVTASIKTINRSSNDDLSFESDEMTISPNTNIEFNNIKYFKFNGQSFAYTLSLTSDGVIAPMIDVDSIKVYAVNNVIRTMNGSKYDKGSTTLTKEENETYPYSTIHEDFLNARYITKVVTLDPEMQTTDCYVYFRLNKPKGTDVKVYIKRQFINNDAGMNELQYEELRQQSSFNYSSDPNKYTEVYFKIPDELATNVITRYCIKIVMFSDIDDSAVVPKIKDLKVITVT